MVCTILTDKLLSNMNMKYNEGLHIIVFQFGAHEAKLGLLQVLGIYIYSIYAHERLNQCISMTTWIIL